MRRSSISETVGDRDLTTIENLQEMTTWESNGHVTDDVTGSWKVTVKHPIYLGPSISKTAGDRDDVNGEHIGNGHLGIKWKRDRWRSVTMDGQGGAHNVFDVHYLENGFI